MKEPRVEMSDRGRLLTSLSGDTILEEGVICPKPRRLGVVTFSSPEVMRPVRQRRSMPSPTGVDGEAGNEILEIFLNKISSSDATDLGCSPPYFSGSPPSRVGNPLVRDEEFSQQRRPPSPSLVAKSKSSAPISFRASPPVRVEGFECSGRGFDCTGRDTRCQVPAFA